MKLLQRKKSLYIGITIIVVLLLGVYNQYLQPVHINGDFKGFEFINNDLKSGKIITVRLVGDFVPRKIGESAYFRGEIIINDDKLDFSEEPLTFNTRGLADMTPKGVHFGMMYINKSMKEMVIEVHDKRGGQSVFISIPSETREQSIIVAKKIMDHVFDGYTVD